MKDIRVRGATNYKRVTPVKYVLLTIFGLLIIMCCVSTGFAETAIRSSARTSDGPGVLIKNGVVSVNCDNIPLEKILRQIEEQGNVWFKGDESLFKERVSVQFKGLSLEDALKRVLASFSYSLIFDAKGRPSGLIIVGKSKPSRDRPGHRVVKVRKPRTAAVQRVAAVKGSSKLIHKPPRPGFTNSTPMNISRIPRPPKNLDRDAPGISPHLKFSKPVKNSDSEP